MESLAMPLVLTKLRPPVLRMRAISRARLVDRINAESEADVLLVCAPAGYGKTTLLAEWAQSLADRGTAVAWVSLDADDDDPAPFGSYLTASFLHALGPLPELAQIARLLRASPETDLIRILPVVINTIYSSGRECVLILDDYHLIGSPAIHSALTYLIDHLPENLRVALGSRSDPPLALARLRARGRLREVRTAGLRFTREEAGQFLNRVMQLDLSEQGVSILEERTEGWIAGLQLAALSILGREDRESYLAGFSGNQRYLVEYLMEEVVNRQPEDMQVFLLATSVLERMCGDLCNVLRGEASDGAAILQQLEQTNLFVVALDDRGEWYRYHHLFRDFLQSRLEKTAPERVRELRQRASEWLAGKNLLREAARQAFACQDWEYAAAFVEQHNFTMIVYGDMAALYEWCSAFPEEVMQRHPMLCVMQALALAYGCRRQNRERVEARLAQVERMLPFVDDREAAQGLIDLMSVVKTFLAFAPDPEADALAVLALGQQMTAAYPEGNTGRFSGLLVEGYAYLGLQMAGSAQRAFEMARSLAVQEKLFFGMIESSFYLARLALAQGDLGRAAEICAQARAEIAALLPNPEQALPALGSLDIVLGCVYLEQDRLAEAEEHLRRGLDLMGGGMNPPYLLTAYTALFRLYEIQGKNGEALEALDRLETAWPDMTICTQGLRARIGAGEPAAADWRQQFADAQDRFLPGIGPVGAVDAYYLVSLARAETQIALGDPKPALAYLERQMEAASANGLNGRWVELAVLQARGLWKTGEEAQALYVLEQTLALGVPRGYVQTFRRGNELNPLLRQAAEQGIYPEAVQRILSAGSPPFVKSSGGTGAIQTMFGESLSERERDVLRLIANGASNQEVAERLVITVGTVKSHMNHILTKLDARNRTEAVAKARALGLLEI